MLPNYRGLVRDFIIQIGAHAQSDQEKTSAGRCQEKNDPHHSQKDSIISEYVRDSVSSWDHSPLFDCMLDLSLEIFLLMLAKNFFWVFICWFFHIENFRLLFKTVFEFQFKKWLEVHKLFKVFILYTIYTGNCRHFGWKS